MGFRNSLPYLSLNRHQILIRNIKYFIQMKNLFTLAAASFLAFGASASNVELVVEAVNNGGQVEGNTYRVYAVLPSAEHSLHAVFADGEHVLNVATTSSFYQHQYGSFSSLDVNNQIVALDAGLAFDSWVTIGATNSDNNNLWTVGVDYNNFLSGSELTITDGAWFVVPTDVQAATEAGNRVLLMQLTTDGTATGILNLQGWDAEGAAWRAHDLTFSSTDAEVFGCTDSNASNFNTDATYNDGSCFGENNGATNGLSNIDGTTEWNIFPIPVFESTFSVKFDRELNLGGENIILEVTDMAGKSVISQEVAQENIVGGNRIVVKHGLAAGNYTVAVKHANFNDAQNIVVSK